MSKPYDRLFKSLAEGDRRGLLHLFGSLPLDAEAEVQAVEREQNLPTLSVDHVYRVRTPQREWLVHFEVQTRYRSDLPKRLAWYAVSLGLGFQLPLEIVLVLLVERYAPAVVPDGHRIDLGARRAATQPVALGQPDAPRRRSSNGRPGRLLCWGTAGLPPSSSSWEDCAMIRVTWQRCWGG